MIMLTLMTQMSLLCAGIVENNQVCNIGSRLELFVDDWLIDKMDGVTLGLNNPIPRESVSDSYQIK